MGTQLMQIIWVAAFGVAGVLSRFVIDQAVVRWVSAFPLGTLIINLLGCALAGGVFELGTGGRGAITPQLQNAILIGFAGGFTTFSAYCLQAATMMDKGLSWVAGVYLFGSPVLGFAMVLGGRTLVRALG